MCSMQQGSYPSEQERQEAECATAKLLAFFLYSVISLCSGTLFVTKTRSLIRARVRSEEQVSKMCYVHGFIHSGIHAFIGLVLLGQALAFHLPHLLWRMLMSNTGVSLAEFSNRCAPSSNFTAIDREDSLRVKKEAYSRRTPCQRTIFRRLFC